jgi:hypothetical protein
MKTKTFKINSSQKKNMDAAGFRLVDADFHSDPNNNLVYWERGQIRLICFKNEPFDLNKFTRDLIGQTEYQTKRNFTATYKSLQTHN